MTAITQYPTADAARLRDAFVGQKLSALTIPTPALVLDRAVARRNCALMLNAVQELGVSWRAHVKTHKTTELARLQVGEDAALPVRLVTSTVAEIETLTPWLQECVRQGRETNVLYGFPISQSSIPRLAAILRTLGQGTIGVFVDHAQHIALLEDTDTGTWPGKIPIFVNIDVGYNREGVLAGSPQLVQIAEALRGSSRIELRGMYTHYGSSYASSSSDEALSYMRAELEGLEKGTRAFLKHLEGCSAPVHSKLILSLGATPTITSAQNLLEQSAGAKEYRDVIDRVSQTFEVEFHAGVYPLLDMQQLATRARPPHSASKPDSSLLSFADIASRILVEVVSLYPDRVEKPEALIGAGTLALGREPCKSYPGWGVVSPWPSEKQHAFYDPEGAQTGWIVGRVSQEHGILSWEGPRDQLRELQVGQRLLVWPNHACIAGAQYGWYLVVDSESEDPDRIEDVWVRGRGW